MSSAMESRTRLRGILAGDRAVHACSLFDPMSARIADELGIEVGLMGGSVASLAVLGAPDVMVLTLTELAEQARRVARAGRLCVLVDADHGDCGPVGPLGVAQRRVHHDVDVENCGNNLVWPQPKG